MHDIELHRLKTQVDSAFDRIDEIDPGLFQLRAEYARYLCVRVSGLFEMSVRHIFSEHSRQAASPQVARYAANRLGTLRSIKSEQLLQLAGAFDPAWRSAVEAFLIDERRDALDSIVINRHAIAHGNPTGITYATVKRYYDRVVELVEFLEGQYVP